MDLFRYTRDTYGQQTLQGISFDLLWVFMGAAVVFIIAHAIYMKMVARR